MARVYDFKTGKLLADLPFQRTTIQPIGQLKLVGQDKKQKQKNCTTCKDAKFLIGKCRDCQKDWNVA
jgi:hypothetical protein